jgi:penicillin-binding protein 1C
MSTGTKPLRCFGVILSLATLSGAGIWMLLERPLPPGILARERIHAVRILDRRGVLLRTAVGGREGRAEWAALEQIAPAAANATVAAEDRRFRLHPGIDPIAILRAAAENLRAGRIRSGGSTITQQVIRSLRPSPRSVANKIMEMWDALRLERMMSKEAILEEYLNRVPYGNGLVGIEAAARSYFGKPARSLSLAEAAFLAGLPNAPTTLNPRRNLPGAIARQRVVLRRMLGEGMITPQEYALGVEEPLSLRPAGWDLIAPHATEMALQASASFPTAARLRTTIDASLQQRVEEIVRSHLAALARKNVTNAAVIVLENGTGEIRALVGSADYFDSARSGAVNGVLARRQPGSAIKPFMYACALEGEFTPSTILADLPTSLPDEGGEFVPENYDRRYHGPVRLRNALACSYNVPAVRTLRAVGQEAFLERLRAFGITTLGEPASYYGYGLTLGNGEVTLLELASAYAALANGGRWRAPVLVEGIEDAAGTRLDATEETRASRQVIDPRTAFLITDILSDPAARRPAFGNWFRFPFSCAVKTGTTKAYRDNWTLGYTSAYTVGVWVGNFDGSEMHGSSGVTGAGPIFCDIISLLHLSPVGGEVPAPFSVPSGIRQGTICIASGARPNRYCPTTVSEYFTELPTRVCDVHRAYRTSEENGAIRTRVYAVYPVEFTDWMENERIPRPPPGARPVEDPSRRADRTQLAILSPGDEARYLLDPVLRREYQSLRIVGAVPPGIDDLRVQVDGEEIPYTETGASWPLRPGSHRIVLVGMRGDEPQASEPVVIHVETPPSPR